MEGWEGVKNETIKGAFEHSAEGRVTNVLSVLENGSKDGVNEGWKDGINEGWKDGINEGWKDGINEGWKEQTHQSPCRL